MIAGENLALVGVELVGEAAPGQALAQAIQEPAQRLGVFRLPFMNKSNGKGVHIAKASLT